MTDHQSLDMYELKYCSQQTQARAQTDGDRHMSRLHDAAGKEEAWHVACHDPLLALQPQWRLMSCRLMYRRARTLSCQKDDEWLDRMGGKGLNQPKIPSAKLEAWDTVATEQSQDVDREEPCSGGSARSGTLSDRISSSSLDSEVVIWQGRPGWGTGVDTGSLKTPPPCSDARQNCCTRTYSIVLDGEYEDVCWMRALSKAGSNSERGVSVEAIRPSSSFFGLVQSRFAAQLATLDIS